MPSSAVRRLRALAGTTLAILLGTGLAATAPSGADAQVASGTAAAAPAPSTMEGGHALRVRKSYRLAAAADDRTVTVGETIRIRGGAVTGPRRGRAKPRPVLLAEQSGGRWKVIARTRTTKAGAWGFDVDAGQLVRTRVFRAEAPKFNGLGAAGTRPVRVRVVRAAAPSTPTPTEPQPSTPTPAPGGDDSPEYLPAGYVAGGTATDWTYLFTNGGGRWNPCRVIRWAYNPSAQGYAALADVRRAFAKISGVSGLTFSYVGETGLRYLGKMSDVVTDQADIVVGWAGEADFPDLAGGTVGIGGASGTTSGAPTDVTYRLTRGYLTLDNGHVLPGGFDQSGWGAVILHEILHAVGLGHATERVQVMYPMLHSGNFSFGAGDITGMQKVGAPSGCF